MSVTTTPFDHSLQTFFGDIDPARDLLLTPNKRLSRFLIERYDALQSTQTFVSLRCLSYRAWLQQLWLDAQFLSDDARVDAVLLSPLQEKLLWQKVVAEHSQTPPLINEQATAAQAQQAWNLLQEWELERGKLIAIARAQGENVVFWQWVEDFEQRCARQSWVCSAQLVSRLNPLLSQFAKELPQRLFLYGFDDVSPSQQRWFNGLRDGGCDIQELNLAVEETQRQRVAFKNESDQLQAAARWARERVQANPRQRIAVVVPDLAAQRARIERIFLREFEPQYLLPDRGQHASGFNISAAQKLVQLPMIIAALQALRCGQQQTLGSQKFAIDHLSYLLHSPFLGANAEREQRAQLDIVLRRDCETQVSFQRFKTLASEQTIVGHCADWYQRLSTLDRLYKRNRNKQFPSEWIVLWLETLKSWGWPGDRTLDTLEYQQWQVWQEVLEEFSGLDTVLGQLDFSAAIAALQQALQQREFQAQTLSSPVQILGLLEAAGLPFDAMWILNLDDENWPPAPRPNPLLPLSVQRQQQLPQSSPEREYLFATRMQNRLLQCCVAITASFATTKKDKAISVSPLIEAWPLLQWQESSAPGYEEILFASRDIETCLDHVGPRVVDLENVRGGSQLLKSQAQCPFQSFARFRLHTNVIEEPSLGLNAMERGNLLHHVMEEIWNVLKNQQQLLRKSDSELLALIENANQQAFLELNKKRKLGKRFAALESARLRDQIMAWLRLEKQRSPFKVLFKEGRKTIKLEKLPIRIRYDRIDELEDGSLFVLDYKTGKTNIRDWSGARPDEPQVPLYAVANEKRVVAAAFGQIAGDDVAFKGIAANVAVAPGLVDADVVAKMELPPGWENIVQHWKQVLNRLAREFIAGSATVDPKDPPNTCRYCELHALCRIKEQFDFDAERDLAEEEEGGDE